MESVQFSMFDLRKDLVLGNLREEWEKLLEGSKNIDLIYQSPDWCNHLLICEPENRLLIGTLENNVGCFLGIVGIRVGKKALTFSVGSRILWKTWFRTAYILGSQPVFPENVCFFDQMAISICDKLPDCECIYMDSLPTESYFRKYLHSSQFIKDNFLIYEVYGGRSHHLISLPGTFEEYLAKFKRKSRYNLKREVSNLTEYANGALSIARFESREQVVPFLEGATFVAQRSWQKSRLGTRIENSQGLRMKLTDLAERGLLRSYLLICDKAPCAFVLGYQFRDIYHYVEIGYDQFYRKYSPGTVLLYLLIEDLILYRPVQKLNFGIGEGNYKLLFGNVVLKDVSVFLFKKNLTNRIRKMGHLKFRNLVDFAKKRLRVNKRTRDVYLSNGYFGSLC